jgi:hypothetical protein
MMVVQNAKGPAASGIACQAGSTISSEETKMNRTTNNTTTAEAPARSISLRLLDIADHIDFTAYLLDALDMATADIPEVRQRAALSSACSVLIGRMDDLKEQMSSVREDLA